MTPTPPTPTQAGHAPANVMMHEDVVACASRLLATRAPTLQTALDKTLAFLAETLSAQRACVIVFSDDGQRFSCLQEHCAPGVPSIRCSTQDVPVESFAWSMSRLKAQQTVEVPNPDSLPADAVAERTAMHAASIKSFVSLPFQAPGGCPGALVLDWLSSEGQWTQVDLVNLCFLAQAIGTALEHLALARKAGHAEARLQSFIAGSQSAVCCFELPSGVGTDLQLDEQWTQFQQKAVLADCNLSFTQLCSVADPGELIGRRVADSQPNLLHNLSANFSQMVENGYRHSVFEFQLDGPQGKPRQLVASLFGVLDGCSLVRVWGTFHDVTQQRQSEKDRQALETQLRQSQRLESIGLLAGGVAHDFNNMLVAVLNYAELALRTLHTNPNAAAEDIRSIIKAGERAAGLTRQLLAFARQQPMHKQGVNLNELIRDLLRLLRRVIHESVDLDFVPGHVLGVVLGDPGQLEQVLLNLVVNANDAIEDIGRITIETENVVLNGSYIKTHPWARPGRYVLLSVSDTGSGMSDEVRERAFEPFFSTKTPDKGSGLGLSTAYGIVKQHDGMIHVYSEPGTGSRFKIYLPIVERAASTVSGRVEAMVRGGNETILVAEDNEMVRQVVCTLLERVGYTVLAASDGGEAARLFDQKGPAIHLALLDAVMPVMSGRAVFHHIQARNPALPVLFASGYTSGVFPEEFLRQHQGRLIEKPYDADTLLRRIREALDAVAGEGKP